jgi:cell wall-associated NlpC family hydrolase
MGWEANYVGKPYSQTGAAPGFHCWGLVRDVYAQHAGIEVEAYGDVAAADLLAVAREMGSGAGMPPFSTRIDIQSAIETGAAKEFDVVVMRGRPRLIDGNRGRSVNIHVGIMVDARMMIHTEAGVDVTYIPLTHPSIRFRVVALYRHEALIHARNRQL